MSLKSRIPWRFFALSDRTGSARRWPPEKTTAKKLRSIVSGMRQRKSGSRTNCNSGNCSFGDDSAWDLRYSASRYSSSETYCSASGSPFADDFGDAQALAAGGAVAPIDPRPVNRRFVIFGVGRLCVLRIEKDCNRRMPDLGQEKRWPSWRPCEPRISIADLGSILLSAASAPPIVINLATFTVLRRIAPSVR